MLKCMPSSRLLRNIIKFVLAQNNDALRSVLQSSMVDLKLAMADLKTDRGELMNRPW